MGPVLLVFRYHLPPDVTKCFDDPIAEPGRLRLHPPAWRPGVNAYTTRLPHRKLERNMLFHAGGENEISKELFGIIRVTW